MRKAQCLVPSARDHVDACSGQESGPRPRTVRRGWAELVGLVERPLRRRRVVGEHDSREHAECLHETERQVGLPGKLDRAHGVLARTVRLPRRVLGERARVVEERVSVEGPEAELGHPVLRFVDQPERGG